MHALNGPLDIVQNSFGLLAEVTAPESHPLVELEDPLNQGCTMEKIFYNKRPWKAPPFPMQLKDEIENNEYALKLCKSAASCMSFHWKHQENTLFHFDCHSEGIASIKKSST